jgi:Na+(H+)/acetate symporter ActP
MFGTAALPHILMRSYTTPSVHETRVSVFWTLFFILLIYLTMPALAVLVKYDIYTPWSAATSMRCRPGSRTGPTSTRPIR